MSLYDVKFLKSRINELVTVEDYEKAARILIWINELEQKNQKNYEYHYK